MGILEKIALVAAVTLPLFNIPLITKVISRKSSADISITWVFGVWTCIVLMAPAGFQSEDVVWRTFNYLNVLLFTCVAFVTWKYRKGTS